MPSLSEVIRNWVENPEVPSLYIPPPDIERECAEPFELDAVVLTSTHGPQQYDPAQFGEMVAEAVRDTSHDPWEEAGGEPVTGIPHGFTELTPAEIVERALLEEANRLRERVSTYSHVRYDPAVPEDRVVVVSTPNPDSVMSWIMERGRNWLSGAGRTVTDSDYPNALLPLGMFDPSPILQGDEHHRVAGGGACVCGFASMFSGDIDRHALNRLEAPGTAVDGLDGVLRKWWNCGRCQLYKPCREYRVAVYNYTNSFADTEALLPPSGPECRTEYWCDECIDVVKQGG